MIVVSVFMTLLIPNALIYVKRVEPKNAVTFPQLLKVLMYVNRNSPKPAPNSLHSVPINHKIVRVIWKRIESMPKSEPQPHQDKLIDQYREIGPAALLAALMSKKSRKGDARSVGNHHSLLAVKESD